MEKIVELTKKYEYDLIPLICACFNIRKTSRIVTQIFNEGIKASGLSHSEYSILTALFGKTSISLGALAKIMVMDRTTLSRNLKPLLNQKLIEKMPGEDRRISLIAITPKGKKHLESAYPQWFKFQTLFLDHFGKEKWNQILEDLNEIVQVALSVKNNT